ncbi:MAG: hypothetical protein M1368_02625, partial [Thaumarchaeota archaeon]|nr:hypothetical protein [Nitrososphaerota archaeon]
LKPEANADSRSPTVTAFYVPTGKSSEIQQTLRMRYGIHVALGFGEYKDTMLRVGHFRNISATDVISLLGALELTLGAKPGQAIASAMPQIRKLV